MQKDKLLHFGVGLLLAAGFAWAGRKYGLDRAAAAILGYGLSASVGILKECYDKRHPDKHTEDADDAAATAIGAWVGSMLALMV